MRKALFLAILGGLAMPLVLAQNNARWVNVFIGTDGTGHTFPGASMPFGMVQPSPDNKDHDWAYTSGYQYRDTTILGFSQTRFSGTGINEMGDILLLPYNETQKQLRNAYHKNTETGSVGYYALTKKDGVQVRLTCSERVAFHQYIFPEQQGKLYLSLQHGLRFLTDSLVLESAITIERGRTISGYCHTKNWVERKYFFVIELSQPFVQQETLPQGAKDKAPQYILSFELDKTKTLQVKIALSTVSVAGARQNLQAEIPHWDFERVKRNAEKTWNKYLNRISIDTGEDTAKKRIFYTALYHLLLQPSNIADVDGQYRGADDKVRQALKGEYYSTLSIWDIYRGAFPLLQLLAPERVEGIVNTLIAHHEAAGFLPIWTAWGQDNYCMIGNHAIPMLLSAYQKGFVRAPRAALQAMIETSTRSHINSDWELYNRYGYYPFDKLDNEAVSRTLESGYDDWCVARMASLLGDTLTAATFAKRARYYQNLFDTSTQFFRGKDSQGRWRSPFDPLQATSPMNNPGDYTEANAWQYFWTPAQHDLKELIRLLGGEENFTKKLDDFFAITTPNPNHYLGQEAMIGQYAHGNEPGHHVVYLYAYSNAPKRGQQYINRITREFHHDTPDGMIGNDDCGQMSAWYILSCLGFYPVNPAENEFVLGSPQVKKAVLRLPNKRTFTMEAKGLSERHIYNSRRMLNGKPIQTQTLRYEQIIRGGNLVFEMEDTH